MSAPDSSLPTGRIYLIGAGPGDPGLLTVRGRHLFDRADVLVFDPNLCEALLPLAPARAERVVVGKRFGGTVEVAPEDVADFMVQRAERGNLVVRLKTGDPFLFGSGCEEMMRCRASSVPVEAVPGVSRVLAAPALAGVPLILRGVAGSVLVLPGRLKSLAAAMPANGAEAAERTSIPTPGEPPPTRPSGVHIRRRVDSGEEAQPAAPTIALKRNILPADETIFPSGAFKKPVATPSEAPPEGDAEGSLLAGDEGRLSRITEFEEQALGEEDYPVDWNAVCRAADTIVFETVYQLPQIRAGLLDGGRSPAEPVALISRGATHEQVTITATITTMADEAQRRRLRLPVTIVVGDVVNLREHLGEFERRPLFKLRLAVTREAQPAEELDEPVRSRGARPLLLPFAQHVAAAGLSELLGELKDDLRRATVLLADSPHTVRHLAEGLERAWLDWRVVGAETRVFGLGVATQREFERRGIRAEAIDATEFTSEALLSQLGPLGKEQRIVSLRVAGAPALWHEPLRAAGAAIVEAILCERQPLRANLLILRQALTRGHLDGVLFFSPEDVRLCVEQWGAVTAQRLFREVTIAAATPQTAHALTDLARTPPNVIAAANTLDSMIDALERWRERAAR